MDKNPIKVKINDLKPGMGVKDITGLSSEYSYLDSRRIAFLQEKFAGATAVVQRDGKGKSIPIGDLAPADNLSALKALPSALGFHDIAAKTVEFFKEQGFQEFLATPSEGGEAEDTGRKKGPAAPSFVSSGGLEHKKRVAESRYFLEKVAEAEKSRDDSSRRVEDMFNEGRADRHSTQPAMEAVEEILNKDVSSAMAAVAGLKASDQTYAHCVDMSVIFHEVTMAILASTGQPINEKVNRSTLAAGFMHDIGKSKVPKEILDSNERFGMESKEMQLMRSHVEEGAKILSDAGMDEAMINVAHYHHVKKDNTLVSCYPKVEFKEVMPLTRLAAIVDVYQALIGKRSYKPNWVPGKAVRYLRSLRGSEFDEPMMDHFLKVIGIYPVGSLLKLSTGDLAFVTKISPENLERPVVVVVENAKGERYGTNPLVDLVAEKDLSVDEVVDHYEHYNDSIEEAFRIFSSLKVV